jgi:hypothetical protein
MRGNLLVSVFGNSKAVSNLYSELFNNKLNINGQYLTRLDNGGNTSYPLLALEETKVGGTTTIDG